MSDSTSHIPHLGQLVVYFNQDRRPHAAFVAYCYPSLDGERPTCNLTILEEDARVARRLAIAPVVFDEAKQSWRLLNRWAFPDEVPDEEWTHVPPGPTRRPEPGFRGPSISL